MFDSISNFILSFIVFFFFFCKIEFGFKSCIKKPVSYHLNFIRQEHWFLPVVILLVTCKIFLVRIDIDIYFQKSHRNVKNESKDKTLKLSVS